MTKLILFDVDRTLLDAGDLSRRCFLRVVRGLTGGDADFGRYSPSGKTDPQILRALLLLNGLATERVDRLLNGALAEYQRCYLSELGSTEVRPLAGARESIVRLREGGHVDMLLGILTGNLEGLVAPKLEAAGIPAESFRVGAYGSDNADRNNLPAIAVDRASRLRGKSIAPREVVIVGDTPLDIACAKHLGAVSVAVATGDYTHAQLAACGADHVLTSLVEWDKAELEATS